MDFDRLSSKYRGSTASEYEAKRLDTKWITEHRAVEELLDEIPRGARVLDAPVGTGRLIPILANRGLDHYGLDVSPDMLSESRDCADRCGASVQLQQGDIRHLPFPDDSFDLVINLRLLNWVDEEGMQEIVRELSRVARDKLMLSIRYHTPAAELKPNGTNLMVRAARLFGLPSLRVRRWGMVLHDRQSIAKLFESVGLRIVETRLIERRWDGTDYVIYWLQKEVQPTRNIRASRRALSS